MIGYFKIMSAHESNKNSMRAVDEKRQVISLQWPNSKRRFISKTAYFNFKSACVVRVANCLKEDWFIVLL